MPTRLQFQIVSLSEWIAVEVKALKKAFGIDLKTFSLSQVNANMLIRVGEAKQRKLLKAKF